MIRHNQTLVKDSLSVKMLIDTFLIIANQTIHSKYPIKNSDLLTDPTPELYPVTPVFPETQPSKTATDLHGDPTA